MLRLRALSSYINFLGVGLYSFILVDMVYSQVCDWLSDFIDDAAPTELLDRWDCEQWIAESEVITIFTTFVVPTFKRRKTVDDALNILKALLWEYYLFRRALALDSISYDSGVYNRLSGSEFSGIVRNSNLGGLLPDGCTNLHAPIIRQIYEAITGSKVHALIGSAGHRNLSGLYASAEGVIDKGCLLGIHSGCNLSETYYCQLQVQMEVYDVDVIEVCMYSIRVGSELVDVSGSYLGAFVAVAGSDIICSPLYDATTIEAANAWFNSQSNAQFWQLESFEIVTMMRNRRWWSTVGLPAYEGSHASDGESSTEFSNSDRIALFVDDDELYKQ